MENVYTITLIVTGGIFILFFILRGFKQKKVSNRTFTNTAEEFEADEKRRLEKEEKEKASKMDEKKEELDKEAQRLHAIQNPDADKPFAKINTLKLDEIPPKQEWEDIDDTENETENND